MSSPRTRSRREFLRTGAVATGGLVLAFTVPGANRLPAASRRPPLRSRPNAFLRIAEDDIVTVLLNHSEMGQGIWTSLSMLIAEELDADWSKITVQHAPAAPTYAHTVFGMQMTGGSTSTWSEFDRYRQAGATRARCSWRGRPRSLDGRLADCRSRERHRHRPGGKRPPTGARRGSGAAGAAKVRAQGSERLEAHRETTKPLDSRVKVRGGEVRHGCHSPAC